MRALIVGSGLAGLSCALELARSGWEVEVITAARAGQDGATHRVHALAPWILLTAPWVRGDSPRRFLADLEARAGGLRRPGLAEVLAAEAHRCGEDLCDLLELRRVDHEPVLLPGDSSPRGLRVLPPEGRPLLAPLVAACREAKVRLAEGRLAVGLLRGETGGVSGVLACDRRTATVSERRASAVVLACGGPGGVFPLTTSPRWCRGSGLALARRAGSLLHNAQLTQALPLMATRPRFFPTSAVLLAGEIEIGGTARPPAADLVEVTVAVAEACVAGIPAALRPLSTAESGLPAGVRSSRVFRIEGKVPLTVALHHGIGGVGIDAWGRASLPGLYACGEAAGGVQGARRTMGTGLLEARVFGLRVARAVVHDRERLDAAETPVRYDLCPGAADARALEGRLDELMGPLTVIREEAAVGRVIEELKAWPRITGGEAASGSEFLAGLRLEAALAILEATLDAVAEARARPG